VARATARQITFADFELMRQGVRLEPLLEAISKFLDSQHEMIDRVRRDLVRGLKKPPSRRVRFARRILHSGDGWLRRERIPGLRTAINCELHQRIVPQPVKVVGILVSARDRRHACHQHFMHRMQDAIRIAVVWNGCRKPLADTKLALRLAQ